MFGAVVLSIGALGLTACDSNGGGGVPPSDLEGTFRFTQFEFVVSGVDDFDLLADTLVASDTSPRLEFFGGNARANLVYRIEGSSGSSFIPGRFTTESNRVSVDFSEADEEDRFQLLLPSVVRFETLNDDSVLVAEQQVEDVDLRRYAPNRYGGLTQNVNGTLHLRLTRQ
jgi:hypothetical protein